MLFSSFPLAQLVKEFLYFLTTHLLGSDFLKNHSPLNNVCILLVLFSYVPTIVFIYSFVYIPLSSNMTRAMKQQQNGRGVTMTFKRQMLLTLEGSLRNISALQTTALLYSKSKEWK